MLLVWGVLLGPGLWGGGGRPASPWLARLGEGQVQGEVGWQGVAAA